MNFGKSIDSEHGLCYPIVESIPLTCHPIRIAGSERQRFPYRYDLWNRFHQRQEVGQVSRNRDITIHEIARRAGVGVGTVSRVLNDSPNVSDATRAQVRQVMAEANYRPKSAAKTLRTRRSSAIAFITDEIASTPFAVDTIRGAQDVAWQHDKILLLVNTNNNQQLLAAAIESMLDRQVEGLIFATWFHRPAELPASIWQLPTVLIDCYVEDRSLPSVVPDEQQGGYAATEVLLRQGHRRIGFINTYHNQPGRYGRQAGYEHALAAAGVPFDPQLVTYQGGLAEGGYTGVEVLMQVDRRPTAIFCYNDRAAMGAYDALREMGLRVPHDVAIVGFDNQEIIAANLRPGLTTLQLPHYEMGAWAVNYLINEAISSSAAELAPSPPQVKLACPLVLRESHAAC
jgi:LacI family transcriptional regulator